MRCPRKRGRLRPVEGLPTPGTEAVDEQCVGGEMREPLQRKAGPERHRPDHPGLFPDRRGVHRVLATVELHRPQPEVVYRRQHLLKRRVDEHPHPSDQGPHPLRDGGRPLQRDKPLRIWREDQTDGIGTSALGHLGIPRTGDSADLDPHAAIIPGRNRLEAKPLPSSRPPTPPGSASGRTPRTPCRSRW